MKERIISAIKVVLMLSICITCITFMYIHEGKAIKAEKLPPPSPPPEPVFFQQSAEEGLKEALVFYDIHHPEIVYAQAILETGYFKSQGCLTDNNLFGLYSSKHKRYHKFNHWTLSVIKYKEWVQKRYKPPEDYYHFLQRIGYAEDPQYVNKLRKIVRYESKSSKGDSLKRDSSVTRK